MNRICQIFLLLSTLPSAFAQGGLTFEEALTKGIAQNPKLKAAESELSANQFGTKNVLSPFLPSIAVEGGYVSESGSHYQNDGTFTYGVGRWNLFNGGKDWANRKISGVQLERSRTNLEIMRASVSRDILRSYTQLLYLSETLKLKEEALMANTEQKIMAQRKAQGGLTSNADVLEFDFRDSELKTEIELLKHERAVASRSLSVAMGEESNSNILPNGRLSMELGVGKIPMPESVEYLRRKATYESEAEVASANWNRQAAYSHWLPTAQIEARYGNMRFAEPEVEEVEPAWRIVAFVSIPIISGTETLYARRQASAQLSAQEQKLRHDRLEVENTIKHRDEKLTVLANLLKMQAENINRAERYYKATIAEYRRGIKNSPDLSGATERFYANRERQLKLTRDYILVKQGLLDVTDFE